jgi:cupin fold WbuC family metalloprotein
MLVCMSAPRALPAPLGPVVLLGQALVDELLVGARASERRRMILPLHKRSDELLHRMFNALQPGTYVRPHRHQSTSKHESFVVLSGALDFIVFDEVGAVSSAHRLTAGGAVFGIDIAPSVFHSFLVRCADTLVFEVKEGPYVQQDDKDFAAWAPAEDSADVASYMLVLERAIANAR